jgi:hypothetical protein
MDREAVERLLRQFDEQDARMEARHQELLKRHRELSEGHRELLHRNRELGEGQRELLKSHRELRESHRELRRHQEKMMRRFERSEGIFIAALSDIEASMQRSIERLDDMGDAIRADTRAVLSVLDRLGPGNAPT